MDSHGVKILHIADSDAVIVLVTHHLILQLLPTLQTFVDDYLGGGTPWQECDVKRRPWDTRTSS